MRRITAVPAALLLAVACSDTTTGPIQPKDIDPSFQSSDSEVHCQGFLTGTFQNVIVRSGAFCSLFNSVLTGNLKALPGSQLSTLNNTIAGSIQADGATFVDIVGDRVGGNIEIVGGPAGSQAGFLDYRVLGATVMEGNIHVLKNQRTVFVQQNTLVKGNIQVEDNFNLVDFIVLANSVPRNIQVYKNMGSGPKTVAFNIAGQSVQCFENQQPFNGQPNTAPNLEGQCGLPPT
jgi:hypothetical protein